MNLGLNGKIALVTGSSRGIGRGMLTVVRGTLEEMKAALDRTLQAADNRRGVRLLIGGRPERRFLIGHYDERSLCQYRWHPCAAGYCDVLEFRPVVA